MKWTNSHNIPEPLVNAIRYDSYRKVGNRSVTALIKPPRIYALEERHNDEIVKDVIDGVFILMGKSVHSVLERYHQPNAIKEQRLTVEMDGWTIGGQADIIYPKEGIIQDYKVTSVFAFILGDKPEWAAQQNIYRWMVNKVLGVEITKLQIVAILRDWTAYRADEANYPSAPVLVVDLPIWSFEDTEKFVRERIRLHQEAEKSSDTDLLHCTDEERWYRGEKWAVRKPGNKTATRVFDNEADAAKMATGTTMAVEHRPGAYTRCERFCSVNEWCNQVTNGKSS